MSNVIFQYKWKGIRSQWDYCLEFIPADTTPLNNPEIIELPSGILVSLNYGFKYDKYPLGFPEAPTLSVEISFNEIPNDNAYDEFRNSLLKPATISNLQLGFGFKKIEFVVGTIVRFKIKPNSSFYTVFTGIVKNIDKMQYNIRGKTISFEVVSLGKHILESFNFESLDYYSDYQHLGGNQYDEVPGIIEFVATNVQPIQFVEHYNPNHNFLLRRLSFLFQYFRFIGSEIARISTRATTAELFFTSEVPIFNLYKQTYNKSGNKGNMIIDPYIVMKIQRYVENKPGETKIDVDGIGYRAFKEIYQNSVWDFLREYAEWMLSKAFLLNTNIIFSYLLGDEEFFIPITTNQIIDITIELNKNRAKTVTASMYEHHSSDVYKDIDNYSAIKNGTLNEDEITIPMIFTATPSVVEYKYLTNPNSQFKQAFFPHVHGLYYLDEIPGFPNPSCVRIHEFCEYFITSNVLSSDLPNCSFEPFNYNQLPFTKIEKMFAALQSTNCMHKWASQTLLEIFSHPNQSYIKIQVPINETSAWEEHLYWWVLSKVPWLIPLANISFDLSSIDPYLPNIEKWNVIESSVDFKTEIADLKLLSILV